MGKKILVFLICVFLIAFPKGGIKVGEVPVTWGYILLALYAAFAIIFAFDRNGNLYLKRDRRLVLGFCLPFQLYCIVILCFCEIQSIGFLLSFILSIIVMPFIFLIFLNKPIDSIEFEKAFSPIFINCVRFVAFFGLFLFFLRYITGEEFVIPFLTVNIDDVGHIAEKYNLRGTISKLISTYNNGNLYGISMIILLPLYFERESKILFKGAFILSLVLTLSRTVWLGLILYLIFYFITKIKSTKAWVGVLCAAIFTAVVGPMVLAAMNASTDFLLDKNLGGRISQLSTLTDFSLFGEFKFLYIQEVVYASILKTFGFVGLILFLLYLFSPILIYYFSTRKRNLISSTEFWGLILYCTLAFSDGAILYIPVMCFYWFLSSYVLRRHSSFE